MQKARLRTGWKNPKREITVAELANALSAICWRMALNAAKNIHEQDFEYDNDGQRLENIRTYLFFLIHCTDRLTYSQLNTDQRTELMTTLSKDCSRHYVQNVFETTGVRVNDSEFYTQLNTVSSSFSLCGFSEEPAYDMYRTLGARVLETMGESQTNKWVIDHVMEIDGPKLFEIYSISMRKTLRSWSKSRPS